MIVIFTPEYYSYAIKRKVGNLDGKKTGRIQPFRWLDVSIYFYNRIRFILIVFFLLEGAGLLRPSLLTSDYFEQKIHFIFAG